MLHIVSENVVPGPDDIVLTYAGRDVVSSLRAVPGEFARRSEVVAEFGDLGQEVLLGRWDGQACFAAQVDASRLDPLRHLQGSLYTLIGRVPDAAFAALGRGIQLQSWLHDHQFCGRCGAPTGFGDGGRALACTRCSYTAYPRISPCIIVAVTRGDELLLAQARGRRVPFFSTLAGFVEAGESAEAAVAREVREEVGLEVSNVRYFHSQAWPFPSQLMLGFYADYAGGDIRLEEEEIEAAGWFRQHDLPPIPPPSSIAGQLIRGFFHRAPSAN